MKATFKPLSLAVAVATASAGYAGITNAQVPDPEKAGNSALGDLAIVPYYSVNNDTNTGISVINTSAATQVVKVRMRRALDSMMRWISTSFCLPTTCGQVSSLRKRLMAKSLTKFASKLTMQAAWYLTFLSRTVTAEAATL